MADHLELQARENPLRRIERCVRRICGEGLPCVVAVVPEREVTGTDEVAKNREIRLHGSRDIADVQRPMQEEDVGERDGDQNRQNQDGDCVFGSA